MKVSVLYLGLLLHDSAYGQQPNVQLHATLVENNAIKILLKNEGDSTCLVSISGLQGPKATPDFKLQLLTGTSRQPIHIVLTDKDPRNRSNKLDSWVVTLSKHMEYGFVFPLDRLRLDTNRSRSLAT